LLVQEQLVPLKAKSYQGNASAYTVDMVILLYTQVVLKVEGIPVVIEAALLPTLPKSVLLGTDVEFYPLILRSAMSRKMEHGLIW